jgi:glycine cleavage system H lipoate-binding protein
MPRFPEFANAVGQYFDPPGVGDAVTKDQPYADIESVKMTSPGLSTSV